MDSDDYKVIYCHEDVENRVYCDICDNLCIERFHKNHPNNNFILVIPVKDNK